MFTYVMMYIDLVEPSLLIHFVNYFFGIILSDDIVKLTCQEVTDSNALKKHFQHFKLCIVQNLELLHA